MASVKLFVLGLVVFAMLSAAGTWARKDSTVIVRETIMNDNVDVSKIEKMIEELAENSENVMIKEVTSEGATINNLKCKNKGEKCWTGKVCCTGVCIANLPYPPVPGRCT